MDLGELLQRRQSQNVVDLRQPPFTTWEQNGVTVHTPNPIATTVPEEGAWRTTTRYAPPQGQLGELAMSLQEMIDKLDQKRFMALIRAGIESRIAEDGGLDVRRYQAPPLPTPNPMRQQGPSR